MDTGRTQDARRANKTATRRRKRRPYTGAGWTRQLASGSWQACWRDATDRIRTESGFRSKVEAEQHLLGVHSDRRVGSYVDPRAGRQTLEAWSKTWLAGLTVEAATDAAGSPDGVGVERSTLDLYEMYLRLHILPPQGTRDPVHLGAMRLVDIDQPTVQRWVAKLAGKTSGRTPRKPRAGDPVPPPRLLSPKYVANIHGCLHAMMAAAVAAGLKPSNPCQGVRLPQQQERPIYAPTPEAFWAVVAELPEWARDVEIFAAFSGLRWGEYTGLRRRDRLLGGGVRVAEALKDRNGMLTRGKTKTKQTRDVPLNATAQAALDRAAARFPDAGPDDLIFRSATGTTLRRSNFYRVHKKAVAAAGVAHMRVHDDRHAFGTWLIDNGADVTEVQKLMGHSRLETTSQYVKPNQDQLKRAVDRLTAPSLESGALPVSGSRRAVAAARRARAR